MAQETVTRTVPAADALLLEGLMSAWSQHEHPGQHAVAAACANDAILALRSGASLSEAVRVGCRTLGVA